MAPVGRGAKRRLRSGTRAVSRLCSSARPRNRIGRTLQQARKRPAPNRRTTFSHLFRHKRFLRCLRSEGAQCRTWNWGSRLKIGMRPRRAARIHRRLAQIARTSCCRAAGRQRGTRSLSNYVRTGLAGHKRQRWFADWLRSALVLRPQSITEHRQTKPLMRLREGIQAPQ